jgi:chromosome segregation ATPase
VTESKNGKKKKKKGAKIKAANNNTQPESLPSKNSEVQEDAPETLKASTDATDESEVDDREALAAGPSTETSVDDDTMTTLTNGLSGATLAESTSDASARFDALVKDRDALRVEVSRLRQSIEELQAKHETDLEGVREQLQETQGEKEEAVEQYQSLLGKVNTIQERLKERLKADAVRWRDVCTLGRQGTDMHVGRPRTSKDTHRRARRAEGRPAGAIHGEVSRVRQLDVRIKNTV